MKSRLKKITIFSLVFLFIFGTAITTTPKQQVKADDGYNGKIFRHWCKLRASKSKRSKVLKRLEIGTPVTVYSTSGKWRKVSVKGQTVAQFAQRFVGNSYVWGGTDLNRGADCSGFIGSVYRSFGYNLPRTSSELRRAGRKVSYNEKQPGDIICYNGHVAMYIGNGKIVHASNRRTGIKISPRANYRRIVCVRRVVE